MRIALLSSARSAATRRSDQQPQPGGLLDRRATVRARRACAGGGPRGSSPFRPTRTAAGNLEVARRRRPAGPAPRAREPTAVGRCACCHAPANWRSATSSITHAPQATVRTACTSDADGASLHSTPATPALIAADTMATSAEPTSITARAVADAARSCRHHPVGRVARAGFIDDHDGIGGRQQDRCGLGHGGFGSDHVDRRLGGQPTMHRITEHAMTLHHDDGDATGMRPGSVDSPAFMSKDCPPFVRAGNHHRTITDNHLAIGQIITQGDGIIALCTQVTHLLSPEQGIGHTSFSAPAK